MLLKSIYYLGFSMAKGFGKAKKSQKNSTKPSSQPIASDCEQVQEQWAEHFENLDDPRGKQRWSINLLNRETSFKKSTRQKAMP